MSSFIFSTLNYHGEKMPKLLVQQRTYLKMLAFIMTAEHLHAEHNVTSLI